MSSYNNGRSAPISTPESGPGPSRRDEQHARYSSPAPEKSSSVLPSHSLFQPDQEDDPSPDAQCFIEDEPCLQDEEDDHSMTEFDLNKEIRPLAASSAAPADREQKASSAMDDDYFPEDESSPMDWETDSSTSDFDVNAEIEAKLGKAPPLPPAEESRIPDPGVRPVPAEGDLSAPLEQYFPEDERSSPDWEDDHSMTSFDPDEEVASRIGGRQPSSAASAVPLSPESTQDDLYYPEDERSPVDWEDDHSGADFDGDSGNAQEEHRPDAATADEGGYMHPGLAASLNASLAYAQHGLRPDGERTDPAANPEEASPGEKAVEKATADATENAPNDRQEKKRPFDGSGAAAPGQENPAVNAPAVADDAAPDPLPGGDDDDEEDDEDDDEKGEHGGPDRPMSLRDHLVELRRRITWAFLWTVAGFSVCYPFAQDLFKLLLVPLTEALEKQPNPGHLIYTSPPEAFFTYMKVSFVAGLFVASPLVFYQIWAFIAPGLYKEEKVYILPIAFFSALFFICGGVFCYFITFPLAFEFFMSYSTDLIQGTPALEPTLSFVLQLLLAFGLIFELPLVVFFLARLGIITADMMRSFRRYAVLADVIVAAILTPPDVMSQLLMAAPLVLLYELSILIAVVVGKKKKEPSRDEDEDEEEDDDASHPAAQL